MSSEYLNALAVAASATLESHIALFSGYLPTYMFECEPFSFLETWLDNVEQGLVSDVVYNDNTVSNRKMHIQCFIGKYLVCSGQPALV